MNTKSTQQKMETGLMKCISFSGLFSVITSNINLKRDDSVTDTCCVMFDDYCETFSICYNEQFIESLTQQETTGLCLHELLHIILGHLSSFKSFDKLSNIACDLHINSLIKTEIAKMRLDVKLPNCGFFPGEELICKNGKPPTSSRLVALSEAISCLPQGMSSIWYYDKLQKFKDVLDSQKSGSSPDELDGNELAFDDHNEVSPSNSERAKDVLKSMMSNIKNMHLDSYGNVPKWLSDIIKKSTETVYDPEEAIKHFIANIVRGDCISTVKRINKRFPYIFAGTKRDRKLTIIIAVDQSGSVSNSLLSMMSDVISKTLNVAHVDIIPFDCEANEGDIVKLDECDQIKRTKRGGTDFSAPTKVVNRLSGDYDCMFVLTDGGAPRPIDCEIPRAWILPKKEKLLFTTQENVFYF